MPGWMMLAAALAAAAATAQKEPESIDERSWITADDYPPQAIRNGDEGLVVMILSVDATGTVADCRIDVSSGAEALDRNSCNLMRTRARFDPARDARGRKVAGTVTKRVSWKLPVSDDRLPLGPVVLEDALVIEAAGFPLACTDRDRAIPARAAICQSPSDETTNLSNVVRWAKAQFRLTGDVQLRMVRRIDHGDEPATTLPAPPAGEFVLREVIQRFDVDAHGVPSACTFKIVTERPGLPTMGDPTTPCDAEQEYTPLTDAAGATRPTKAVTIERASIRAAPASSLER